ncbi:hypothetical protein RRG08_004587 [Elysia crispata]|uniref:Uncharacterized protein n=1 Tax=Elysia crispata TaxID=231223 RepID=A0AAE1ALS3_9GAST|nr:hypothetical protein RRG08_004587 [Elysia crispata]
MSLSAPIIIRDAGINHNSYWLYFSTEGAEVAGTAPHTPCRLERPQALMKVAPDPIASIGSKLRIPADLAEDPVKGKFSTRCQLHSRMAGIMGTFLTDTEANNTGHYQAGLCSCSQL